MELDDSKLKQSLSPTHFENIQRSNAASIFLKGSGYQILTLKFFELEQSGLEDYSVSYVFIQNEIYEVGAGGRCSSIPDRAGALADQIEARAHYAYEILSGFNDEIENLEDMFYERRPPRYFMDFWLNLKKDVSKIERNLTRASLAIREFLKSFEGEAIGSKTSFLDLVESLEVHSRSCSSHLNKLDNLRHYFDSIKSDKLNGNIYFLALVSGVFLPMNLIVGFFGINTPNLFFLNDAAGSYKVLYILVGVFLTLIFGLPLLRAIDQILLRKLLGRYNFYRRISDKIENFSNSLNIK